ncbi:MAG: ABC transporter substrate-binding protein [Candidatus Bathyarchaeia archaeon]
MSKPANVQRSLGILIIIIVVAGGFLGVWFYSGAFRPNTVTTQSPVPSFVQTSTYVAETGSQFQWLDPHVSYYSLDYEILCNVYEKLLWYNGNSSTEVIPWLASSYEQITPTQYQFNLRHGISFQDGTNFTARAVWFSLNRLLIIDGTSGTGVHGSQAAWIAQQMLDPSLSSYLSGTPQSYDPAWVQRVLAQNFVQIVDPYTININIRTPTTQFPYLLANEWADIVSPTFVVQHDYPSACMTTACGPENINYTAYFDYIAGHGDVSMNYLNLPVNGAKAGTGPYYIDSVDPTTFAVVLKANSKYWGGPGNWSGPRITQSIKTIDYLYVPSFTTRLLDLEAGKATDIDVSPDEIYSVADRSQWLDNGILSSTISGATIYGPYSEFTTDWFAFDTNVTSASGQLLKFQPMADIRFRLAIADSINMTDACINIFNRLCKVANNLIPPGTAPEGVYNASITPRSSYNLTEAESLLLDAQKHPLTNFVDSNGEPLPPGSVDNSFGPSNPQTIPMYVGAADTSDQKILETIASNLNGISSNDNLGLTFSVVPVPGGDQYTLASEHQIYMYWGSWIADYNYVIDWLGPMYLASGTYFSQSYWNITQLNNLYNQAISADQQGNVQSLIQTSNQMQALANQGVYYLWTIYEVTYYVRSSYLQGYFFNAATVENYYASYSYS